MPNKCQYFFSLIFPLTGKHDVLNSKPQTPPPCSVMSVQFRRTIRNNLSGPKWEVDNLPRWTIHDSKCLCLGHIMLRCVP